MIYIVGTPIGNLQDLSYRQAKILSSAEVILTEDTRKTGILISEIKRLFSFERNPQQKLISYYKEREFEKLPQILDMADEGKELVLISEAGMPLISDPGNLLVQELVKRNIPFTVIPGPTAAVTALLYTGMDFRHFLFYGFLPKKENDVAKTFRQLRTTAGTIPHNPVIFYESGSRINKTLRILAEVDPEASVSVSRELTKLFEETVRGKACELMTHQFKGELVLTVLFSSST